MTRIAYVNGRYVHHHEASVHIEDRGYQFADGVYEYIAFYNRRMLDGGPHLDRLRRSLAELEIAMPMSLEAMHIVLGELVWRNGREDGGIYMQVTRGVARRDHPFPRHVKPAFVATVCAPKTPKAEDVQKGVKVITHPDIRWGRRDIKSIALLPNVLAKQEAARRQVKEAWLVSNGQVTEGAASNAYIVDGEEAIVTHPANQSILGGITRDAVLKLARAQGITVREQAFTVEDALAAREAFMTSASANVLPVVKIDNARIADGRPGAITRKLHELYSQHAYQQTGKRF